MPVHVATESLRLAELERAKSTLVDFPLILPSTLLLEP